MKFKKLRKKDYESKEDYYNAFLAENWWRVLILFTLTVVIMALITFFTSLLAFVGILFCYALFIIMFTIESISQKKDGCGSFMADPFTILIFYSIGITGMFIASFFM